MNEVVLAVFVIVIVIMTIARGKPLNIKPDTDQSDYR